MKQLKSTPQTSLTEQIDIDSIEVFKDNTISVNQTITIFRDGEQFSTTHKIFTLSPGDDLTGLDSKVVTIANAVWNS